VAGRIRSIEKCNNFVGNRTRDLPACRTFLLSWLFNDALSIQTVQRRVINERGAVGGMIIGRGN
jgi:hypothetical protein